MVITEIERYQLLAVRDDIIIAINSVPFAVNFAQIAANNLFALIDQSEVKPMTGIPVTAVQKIVDELTALIKGDVPQQPPPTVIVEGDAGVLAAAGHAWAFGAHVDDRGSKVLRDGVQYASGVAHKLVKDASDVVWAEAGGGIWYKDNGQGWSAGGAGPIISAPHPPPVTTGTASPDGTTITAPGAGQSIVDSSGHVWTFGALMTPDAHHPGPDYAILKDGTLVGQAQSMAIRSDAIWAYNVNRWGDLIYKDAGAGWTLVSGTP